MHNKAERRNIVIPHGFQNHYTIGFANGLARNGVKISLITSDDLDVSKLDRSIECHNFIGDNSPNRNTIKKTLDYVWYNIKLLSFVVRNRNANLHVIGLLKYPVLLGILENLILKAICHRLFLTVHNLLPHDSRTVLKKKIYEVVYRIPDYLVVHTEKMKNELSAMFNIRPARIVVMQHGMNEVVGCCGNSGDNVRRGNNISEDQVILLSFGKLAPYKGIDILLESFGMLGDNYYLIIAGHPSSKDYENTILHGIETNRNKERILFVNGYIDDNDVGAYFKAADVLVMPYRHIDQSGVLFLSMSMGLPVIAFNVGMLGQYVSEKVGLVVDRMDRHGLTNAVKKFRRERYDRNEIRKIGKSYGWENVVKPIVDLYAR